MLQVDICVIGAGSGGLSVASGAAQLGMSVALIEKGEMGGDCLNRGCVPSKALLAMAKKGTTFRQAHNHVKDSISAIAPHDSQERFENMGCHVIRQAVHFIDANTVETADGKKIRARYFVIAAGSRPFMPEIKGLKADKVLTNETIFNLEKKPDHLVIIGGGPIGVEMAQAHIKLGCQVTLITRGEILPKDDPDCVEVVRRQLTKDGVTLHENTDIDSMTFGKMPTIKIAKNTIIASHILIATGRQANVDTLNLGVAKIKYDNKGIKVNKRLRTNRSHIYAIGDINKDGPQFTHAAGYQAGIVIGNICFRMRAKVDYKTLPWVTYTSPELAHVGMTQNQAEKTYGKRKIRSVSKQFASNDRAVTEGINTGFIKVIAKRNGKILGVSIVGEQAGDMLPLWLLAMQKDMKIKDIAGLILPYPTLSEVHKAITSEWYRDTLFSDRTRFIVRILQKLPSF